MAAEDHGNITQWFGIIWAVIAGFFAALMGLIKIAFSTNNRLMELESKDIRAIVRQELEDERHNVLYPMLQVRVYSAIDKIEEELKTQGQNIAVLLERDRTAAAFERMIPELSRTIASSITEALKSRS